MRPAGACRVGEKDAAAKVFVGRYRLRFANYVYIPQVLALAVRLRASHTFPARGIPCDGPLPTKLVAFCLLPAAAIPSVRSRKI